jgi:hypothetical protein
MRRKTQFFECDVTKWDDQLKMFKGALALSPINTIEVVIANAGISGPDILFTIEGPHPCSMPPSTVDVAN